ncbi:hypothetical protein PV733_28215 [Streptomyces europaeiscabiei]|uniref:hypothetical protein n=1 Tax=Streptomyces europaeiscabiei TaxID=146819 RepID=UPI0029AFD9A2|nr:hypothetical protein [Streptomyces europaeiscabiei]MDX3712756.1 hypothetical protein [Streptomyces europaeiscabiei]
MSLTAIADALSEHPEEPMCLGVLLGLSLGESAVLRQAPEIPEGATRGEYALVLRLTVLEVHP